MHIDTKKSFIIEERVDLYHDFTINLIGNIIKYYIDEESLCEDEDIYNHFNWCFNRVCKEFEEEEIFFNENNELREYFKEYFYTQFYITKKNSEKFFKNFWGDIFSKRNVKKKRKSTFVLIEAYKIFDKSLPIKIY